MSSGVLTYLTPISLYTKYPSAFTGRNVKVMPTPDLGSELDDFIVENKVIKGLSEWGKEKLHNATSGIAFKPSGDYYGTVTAIDKYAFSAGTNAGTANSSYTNEVRNDLRYNITSIDLTEMTKL